MQTGLITLRNLILYREPLREALLPLMLQYAVDGSKELRKAAVSMIKGHLFCTMALQNAIIEFATNQLNIFIEEPSKVASAEASMEDVYFDVHERLIGEEGWNDLNASQHLDLFYGLLEEDPPLVDRSAFLTEAV